MRCVVALLAICLLATVAQAKDPAGRPPGPVRQGPADAQPLTASQKAKVETILSRYEADSMTSTDAKAINDAFRAAGLRNGPGLQEAIRDADFDPETISKLDPPPSPPADGRRPAGERKVAPERGEAGQTDQQPPRRGGGGYSIEQAISDRAQLHTIAFDGLAFLTGGMGGNTFLPPGKVADYCGFQYMRDVDVNELGHNTSFVPLAANNVLYILDEAQMAELIALSVEQEKLLAEFAHKRFPLIKAFYRRLKGDMPDGTNGLDREAVMECTAEAYEIDGLLSYRRAEILGGIVRSLTNGQKAALAKMKLNDSSTWPELEDQVDKRSMSRAAHVAVMTYASEMFSWYAGGVESDVYFCPERHATYFGSFFMKDIPAMGNPDFTISTALTGDSGEAFLNTLTADQRRLVTELVDRQRADLEEIVETRRQIATLLRLFMTQKVVDEDKVMALSRRYGELDGEISYFYATAFAEVARTLTADQQKALMKLRNLDPKYEPQGAFLYSAPIDMPEIPNTDFLFSKSADSPIEAAPAKAVTVPAAAGALRLTSPAVVDGERLPVEYTGDGSSATLPLQWVGAPTGTRSFVLIMHHVAPDMTKWYWTLYDIPAATTALPKNVERVGTLGTNSVNHRCAYAPPHSKGPGDKTYVYTLYALSSPTLPDVDPAKADRDALLAAMDGKVLASAQLSVVYARDVPARAQDRK